MQPIPWGNRLNQYPMRVGLVVPPFIPVPPERYGGTELFVAQLAEGLRLRGHMPVVYTVGASKVACKTRWRWPRGSWPIEMPNESSLDDLDHASWACAEAAHECDVIHANSAPTLSFSRFLEMPWVCTLHHPHEPTLSRYYGRLPEVHYVAISHNQAHAEVMPNLSVVHHGLDTRDYELGQGRREYLAFVGRIAPIKGTHHAIAVARKAGLPLKIAGEIQPIFRDYWETRIRPQVDGREIEYVGEVNLKQKNQLLSKARALLFPIEWEEPFGLVMIEAMACGAPVLAFARGSAPEVVADGISGWLCHTIAEMAMRARTLEISATGCRRYVEQHFSLKQMVDGYLEVYARLSRRQAATKPVRAAL